MALGIFAIGIFKTFSYVSIAIGLITLYRNAYNNPEGRVKSTKVISPCSEWCIITNTNTVSFVTIQTIYQNYDFIVIGGGSAGAVLANRLTEIDEWDVLLLEAGGDETIVSDVPGLAVYLQGTDIDWQYKTEALPTACLAFNAGRYVI